MAGTERKALSGGSEEAKLRRHGRVVSDLRTDITFSDADVLVGDERILVHRNVVCCLSGFFLRGFLKPTTAGERPSIKIANASPSAMNIVLDFEYGISVAKKLGEDLELACEVMSLSHRFEVKVLTGYAATAAGLQATVENCIRLFRICILYSCEQSNTAMLFIMKRLAQVGKHLYFKVFLLLTW